MCSLAVSEDEIDIGQNVEISVIVKNTGQSAGSYEVKLNVNGTVIETKNVMLDGGEEQNLMFTLSADEAGEKLIDVNGLTGQFIVRGEVAPPVQVSEPAEEIIPTEVIGTPAEAGSVAEISPPSETNLPQILGISGGGLILAGCVFYFAWWRRRARS